MFKPGLSIFVTLAALAFYAPIKNIVITAISNNAVVAPFFICLPLNFFYMPLLVTKVCKSKVSICHCFIFNVYVVVLRTIVQYADYALQ